HTKRRRHGIVLSVRHREINRTDPKDVRNLFGLTMKYHMWFSMYSRYDLDIGPANTLTHTRAEGFYDGFFGRKSDGKALPLTPGAAHAYLGFAVRINPLDKGRAKPLDRLF